MKMIGLIIASCMVAVVLNACSAPPETVVGKCNPEAALPDPECIIADAGTDADTEAGQNAIGNPGLDPANMEPLGTCKTGICVPVPSGNAGLWAEPPISLWIGPAGQAPAKCPDDPVYGVPNEKFRLYDKLVAPAAVCSSCSCGPSEGTCNGVPEKIELRAGKCNQSGVQTIPFDGPANWDGSCSNDDTIAAGAKCPAGSQTLCTQSVNSAALPLPPDEACPASVSAPSLELKTTWAVEALACHANTQAQSCSTETLTRYCVNDPGPAWLQCTYREGVHDTCPSNYNYRREVLSPKEPVDNRGCSACECGKPAGSACIGALSLSADDACTAEHVKLQVASTADICYDFVAPGIGISSKAIVNRTYLPGMCAASGGEPVGSASADVDHAVTFCCMEPFVEIKPPT